MYLLGFDIGSSSVKGAVVHAPSGKITASGQYPDREMEIMATQPGFAEQDPDSWWQAVCHLTPQLLHNAGITGREVKGIGISYQMHGLVIVDQQGKPLRPAIIWCDSRAVPYGEHATTALGAVFCQEHYLNEPGNFTASKLAWVREHEPDIFKKIQYFMLPGDYIAYRLSGEIQTTITGLSEGILYDFKEKSIATPLLDHFQIPVEMVAPIVPAIGIQSVVSAEAASLLGLVAGTPIAYRAGDQPNNAMSLNVLRSGEVAATGGTSGVIYAVSEGPVYDPESRVNSFAHVNYSAEQPFTGILLCINGCGSQYRWIKAMLAEAGISYPEMEKMAADIPAGSAGLVILPFGNGAERMLNNRQIGASVQGLDFNIHHKAHLYRAALEGIACAFNYGTQILKENGVQLNTIKAGSGNLFESRIFAQTLANLTRANIQIMDTNGAVGAARAAGVATGWYASLEAAMQQQTILRTIEPEPEYAASTLLYQKWLVRLQAALGN